MLDIKGLDFSYTHRILQQNSTPKARGILDLKVSAAHTMYKLDILVVNEKLCPLLSIYSKNIIFVLMSHRHKLFDLNQSALIMPTYGKQSIIHYENSLRSMW
jgi:hypothetical protein